MARTIVIAGCLTLFVVGCGAPPEQQVFQAEGDHAPEQVGSVQSGLTSSCAASIVRYKFNGELSTSSTSVLENDTGGTSSTTAYYMRCTPAFAMSAGDRHFAKMVGNNDASIANPADLQVQSYDGASWSAVVTSATPHTSTEVIDWSVDASGTYRVCAVASDTTEPGTDWVRITSDRSSASACGEAGSGVDFCFGAIGSNCNSCTTSNGLTPAGGNATQSCMVTVGANMHDTCCSHNPLGDQCNGSACNPGTGGTNCGWFSDCSKEYTHAQNDVGSSRYWHVTFDPTTATYRPLSQSDETGDYAYFYTTDYNKSKPCGVSGAPCPLTYAVDQNGGTATLTSSLLAPSGQGIWNVDADNGWCASGSAGSLRWSLQGYYKICN